MNLCLTQSFFSRKSLINCILYSTSFKTMKLKIVYESASSLTVCLVKNMQSINKKHFVTDVFIKVSYKEYLYQPFVKTFTNNFS